MTSILCKRPVAFRVPRIVDDRLSGTEWQLFNDEDSANAEAEAKGCDYQALFVRDGAAIVAEWKPIETAPKDGTPFLCFRPDALGHGFSDQSGIDVLWWENGDWTYDGDGRVTVDPPTHWMPLPAPPQR